MGYPWGNQRLASFPWVMWVGNGPSSNEGRRVGMGSKGSPFRLSVISTYSVPGAMLVKTDTVSLFSVSFQCPQGPLSFGDPRPVQHAPSLTRLRRPPNQYNLYVICVQLQNSWVEPSWPVDQFYRSTFAHFLFCCFLCDILGPITFLAYGIANVGLGPWCTSILPVEPDEWNVAACP